MRKFKMPFQLINLLKEAAKECEISAFDSGLLSCHCKCTKFEGMVNIWKNERLVLKAYQARK